MPNRSTSRKTPTPDPISMLTDDHRKVQKLFKQFEKLEDDGEKETLARHICAELKVHTTLEEEIFYPFARECLDEQDLLDEAQVEHTSAKELIEKIEGGQPSSDLYDAQVKVLGEYVNHHIREEEGELFPKLGKFRAELEVPGVAMMERKEELMAEMGLAEPAEAADEAPMGSALGRLAGQAAARAGGPSSHAGMRANGSGSARDRKGNRDRG